MLVSPKDENELNGSAQLPNPVAVREQLKRLLGHPLFTNSKRYPVLLAYAVEQTLLGNAGELKERTIGIEAFGREPSYDVNLDPVVRTTAAEVRKRLIQYYYSPEHAGELVIELHVGSYVPTFRNRTLRRLPHLWRLRSPNRLRCVLRNPSLPRFSFDLRRNRDQSSFFADAPSSSSVW